MRVRPFQESDAPVLARIFFTAVREIAGAHYTHEQILAWAPEPPSPERFSEKANDGRILLVAVDENEVPIAYGDLEPNGHIDHLYCLPAHSRTGVAASVYEKLEIAARDAGMARLYVEASEPARRFFEKHGFVVDASNDFKINAVAIHNWRMSKQLSPEREAHMATPKIFIQEQSERREEISRRIELMRNHLAGATEDSVGSTENFMDVTQREIDRLEAEIAEIDARIARLRNGEG